MAIGSNYCNIISDVISLYFILARKKKFKLIRNNGFYTQYLLSFETMEKFYRNKNLLEFIWKWKWIYVITILMAIITSVIFSGPRFIRPKYKSFAIVYPSNLQKYSDENKTEQMLQTLQSEQLKLKLIDAFQLHKHYDIDKKYKYAQTALFRELNDNISISKTAYESVKIEVLDYYPDTAKMMVDSIIEFYNQRVRQIQNIKYKEIIDIDATQIKRLTKERDSLSDILTEYREKYNIFKPRLQTKEITKSYLEKKDAVSKKLYENLLKHSNDIFLIDSLLEHNKSRIVGYQFNMNEAIKNYTKKISYANIISSPIVADKKSYPIRWVIVMLSALGTFLFTFIALVFNESIQKKS